MSINGGITMFGYTNMDVHMFHKYGSQCLEVCVCVDAAITSCSSLSSVRILVCVINIYIVT